MVSQVADNFLLSPRYSFSFLRSLSLSRVRSLSLPDRPAIFVSRSTTLPSPSISHLFLSLFLHLSMPILSSRGFLSLFVSTISYLCTPLPTFLSAAERIKRKDSGTEEIPALMAMVLFLQSRGSRFSECVEFSRLTIDPRLRILFRA